MNFVEELDSNLISLGNPLTMPNGNACYKIFYQGKGLIIKTSESVNLAYALENNDGMQYVELDSDKLSASFVHLMTTVRMMVADKCIMEDKPPLHELFRTNGLNKKVMYLRGYKPLVIEDADGVRMNSLLSGDYDLHIIFDYFVVNPITNFCYVTPKLHYAKRVIKPTAVDVFTQAEQDTAEPVFSDKQEAFDPFEAITLIHTSPASLETLEATNTVDADAENSESVEEASAVKKRAGTLKRTKRVHKELFLDVGETQGKHIKG